MKKVICLSLMVSILFAGCAGREANPVAMYTPGDENRSCKGLFAEMSQIQQEIDVLRPKTNKFATNAAWATAGVFLIVPFFFMDLKEAEKIAKKQKDKIIWNNAIVLILVYHGTRNDSWNRGNTNGDDVGYCPR